MTKIRYKNWTATTDRREEILAPEPVNRMLAMLDTGPVQLVAIPEGTCTLRQEARRHDLTLAMQCTAQLKR